MNWNEYLEDPRVWVALAFVLFIGLCFKLKLGHMLTRALDERSAKIKSELDEAHRLREEAEAILAQYKQKQAHYLKEAEGILNDTREDAKKMRAYVEQELKNTLETRMKQALEKIAQEESKAVADVRNHVVDIALAAARALIVEHVSTLSPDDLLKLAITDIERKIH